MLKTIAVVDERSPLILLAARLDEIRLRVQALLDTYPENGYELVEIETRLAVVLDDLPTPPRLRKRPARPCLTRPSRRVACLAVPLLAVRGTPGAAQARLGEVVSRGALAPSSVGATLAGAGWLAALRCVPCRRAR